MAKKLDNFISKIGIKFKNLELIKTALTHRSYINEHKKEPISHNERLEFLGDAVLELAVTYYLFTHFEDKTEGELTNLRAALFVEIVLSFAFPCMLEPFLAIVKLFVANVPA